MLFLLFSFILTLNTTNTMVVQGVDSPRFLKQANLPLFGDLGRCVTLWLFLGRRPQGNETNPQSHVKKIWICLPWDFIEWFTLGLKDKNRADGWCLISVSFTKDMCSSLELNLSWASPLKFWGIAQLWPRQPNRNAGLLARFSYHTRYVWIARGCHGHMNHECTCSILNWEEQIQQQTCPCCRNNWETKKPWILYQTPGSRNLGRNHKLWLQLCLYHTMPLITFKSWWKLHNSELVNQLGRWLQINLNKNVIFWISLAVAGQYMYINIYIYM